ncbi:DNA polymerase III subunit delta' [Desulfatirhabdium butyrativorans]|uniref:DNA polymerase III subunit delta' n=1 Tax=Desulfatirhabdium butyrativorans TaxID=340467 RepID=UPI00040EAE1B|nr:DNA polymerase III subunit delta' [Desulfatirhabdium butyrativorans]
MAGFDDILGQDAVVTILKRAVSRRRVPHAWLFCGPEGVGKSLTAAALALELNCRNPVGPFAHACGVCPSCKAFIAESHPDFIRIQPQKNEIRIAQVRELCATLEKKPFSASKRMVLIKNIEKMNVSAANAALKILEEPPENTHFILTTQEPARLLPTIRSRCQVLVFHALPEDVIERLLRRDQVIDDEKARLIASQCSGNMKRALSMVHPEWFRLREWLFQSIEQLDRFDPSLRLAFGESILSKPKLLAESLDLIASWYRDAIDIQHRGRHIINIDRSQRIAEVIEHRNSRDLLRSLDIVLRFRSKIESRANAKLMMDTLVLTLA